MALISVVLVDGTVAVAATGILKVAPHRTLEKTFTTCDKKNRKLLQPTIKKKRNFYNLQYKKKTFTTCNIKTFKKENKVTCKKKKKKTFITCNKKRKKKLLLAIKEERINFYNLQ